MDGVTVNAGIWNDGELDLSGLFYTLHSEMGGAIYNRGDLIVQGSFYGNQADLGGAIYNTGIMDFRAAVFSGNRAESRRCNFTMRGK